MTTPLPQASAKIYQFPVRPRIVAAVRRIDTKPVFELAAPSTPPIVYGSGWYHDAAIQDAQRPGKR